MKLQENEDWEQVAVLLQQEKARLLSVLETANQEGNAERVRLVTRRLKEFARYEHFEANPACLHVFNESLKEPKPKIPLRDLYWRHRDSMAYIVGKNKLGDENVGTGFCVGNGLVVTARHVAELQELKLVAFEEKECEILSVHLPENELDCAILKTRMSAEGIEVSYYLDDQTPPWALTLSKVLVMGFPRVPSANGPHLLAVTGEISGGIDRYLGYQTAHFVLSMTPRAGFSGAPVILEDGSAIGLVIEALVDNHGATETGFFCAINTDSVLSFLAELEFRPAHVCDYIWELYSKPPTYHLLPGYQSFAREDGVLFASKKMALGSRVVD